MPRFTFSVLTATYNRRHTLPLVYESLARQTFRDFEWIVVDDGSTDGTGELVEGWRKHAGFPVAYHRQENRGKHVAVNRGVQAAAGDFVLPFDDDNTCVPEALERFHYHWEAIPREEREKYANLSCLCQDERGQLVGKRYPRDVMDVDSFWEQFRMRSGAERWGINRTEVMRQYPYEEIPGERFLFDGLAWNRMASAYRSRFVNEALAVYRPREDRTAWVTKIRVASPQGTRLYYAELSRMRVPLRFRLRTLINYGRFSFHAGVPRADIVAESAYPGLTRGLLPAAFLAYRRDCQQLQRSYPSLPSPSPSSPSPACPSASPPPQS